MTIGHTRVKQPRACSSAVRTQTFANPPDAAISCKEGRNHGRVRASGACAKAEVDSGRRSSKLAWRGRGDHARDMRQGQQLSYLARAGVSNAVKSRSFHSGRRRLG